MLRLEYICIYCQILLNVLLNGLVFRFIMSLKLSSFIPCVIFQEGHLHEVLLEIFYKVAVGCFIDSFGYLGSDEVLEEH